MGKSSIQHLALSIQPVNYFGVVPKANQYQKLAADFTDGHGN
jgi:hypothetical protein